MRHKQARTRVKPFSTGHRAVPKSVVDALPAATKLSLDQAIEYLHNDELLEVTPESLRIRKKVLNHSERQRSAKRAKFAA